MYVTSQKGSPLIRNLFIRVTSLHGTRLAIITRTKNLDRFDFCIAGKLILSVSIMSMVQDYITHCAFLSSLACVANGLIRCVCNAAEVAKNFLRTERRWSQAENPSCQWNGRMYKAQKVQVVHGFASPLRSVNS